MLMMLPLGLLQGSTHVSQAPDSFLDARQVVAGVWQDGAGDHEADSSYNADVIMGLLDRTDFNGVITLRRVAREDAMNSLESQQVHIAGTLGITSLRERRVDFVGPLASSRLGVLVRSDNKRIEKISDLSRRTVCMIAGSTSVDDLTKVEEGARIVLEKDFGDCRTGLLAGRVAAIVGDRLTLAGMQLADRQDTKLVDGIRFGPRTSTGFAIAKGNHDTCQRLRTALRNYVGSNDWRKHFSERLPLTRDFLEAQPTLEEINEMSCRGSTAG
ncbi:transporter substrate-binding domain-containing protein [Actinomadura sp. KC06]|nr:transporter substrate-binding domain-containing protein [Actinomadura sp. KC06]